MGAGPQRPGPVPQAHPRRHRRLAEAAGHRFRRPLPDPPLGLRDADRGDDGGAERRGAGRQGPLHRRVEHVRLAVRQGAAHGRDARLDAVRLDAEPLQPRLPRGGARDDPALPRPGRRRHPVEPAGARAARRRPRTAGRPERATTRSPTGSTATPTARSSTRSRSLADERGLPPAQIALAWLLARPGVTAPIVGATKLGHIEDAVAAVDVTLSEDEMARLEAPYRPHPVLGHS